MLRAHRSSRLARHAVLSLATICALGAMAVPSAQAAWTNPPAELSPYSDGWESAGNPQAARLPSGTTLFVWSRYKANCCGVVQARLATPNASSPSGYSLGPVKNLSTATPGVDAFEARVVVHGSGFLVVWSNTNGSIRSIYARTVSSTATLGTTTRVSGRTLRSARPQVDSMNGRAVIAWDSCVQDDFGCWPQVQARTFGTTYGTVRVMSKPESAVTSWFPAVAVDADGDAVVVWHRLLDRDIVQGAVLSAAGVRGPIKDLSASHPSTNFATVDVDVNSAGVGRVAWGIRTGPDGSYDVVESRTFSTAGVVGSTIQRLGTGFGSSYPRVVVGAGQTTADATVVWFRNGSSTSANDTNRILGRRIAANNTLGGTWRLSPFPADAAFAFAPAGGSGALVAWTGATSTGSSALQTRALKADNTLSPLQIAARNTGSYPGLATGGSTFKAALAFDSYAGGNQSHVHAVFGP